MIRYLTGSLTLGLFLISAGCAEQMAVETSGGTSQPSAEGARYLLSEAPADPQDVIPMRKAAQDEQEVLVVGRIGGSANPWVDGVAAFSLVDRSLPACTDIAGDTCPTPWDYCCATDRLSAATTLVKFVDENGRVVPTGAKELLGLNELQTVVIQGKASKDEAGNVAVLARGIYVDPSNPGQVKRGTDTAGVGHAADRGHQAEGDDAAEGSSVEAPRSSGDEL